MKTGLFYSFKNNNRYRVVVSVCLPLVMSMAAITVMEFTDRVFLSNYSLNAISAATPAGSAFFLLIAFFGGIAGFTNVFIAQYSGAGAQERVGRALWQGIYFSLFSGAFIAALVTVIAKPLFALADHPAEIQRLEAIYFQILGWGSIFQISNHALSGFFAGRGKTRPVMLFNAIGMIINIPLDYALINGIWIFPELGITGAAIATVFSWLLIMLLFCLAIFTPIHQRIFQVRTALFDPALLARLLKVGVPGAMQFSLDVFAFTFFVFMVGRIGKVELAVSNMVISINSLAFMPALGFSYGVSALVGQALGSRKPQEARYATLSAIHILMVYILVVDILFIFAPGVVISLFIPSGEISGDYGQVMKTGKNLLRIVAAYVFMGALYMTFAGVLKGAGDTRFLMWSMAAVSLLTMILPLFIGIEVFNLGVGYAWLCVLCFITALFLMTSFRYRQGKWKDMLVVEREIVM